MTMANVIDISEYQDPAKFDYQAAKSNGIKAVIIRLSVGNRRDNHAAEHITNCKKYGLKWHGYHYWYNLSGEAAFAVSDAQSLGLTSSQYFFLDMEDKTLSSDWSAQFESFRSAVGDKYKIGLYCSDSPYKSHFDNTKMVAEGIYRWIAAYSYEPANYDTWQMSGEGSGGFGSYTGDVDRDYDKTGNLFKEEAQPITPSTTPLYRQIIGEAGYDTDSGIYGLGRSYDNGKTFHVMDTVYGRIYRQQDGDSIWPFLVDKVKAVLDWSTITNKPDLALKTDLTWSSITDKPDIALKSDLTWSNVTGKPDVALKSDVAAVSAVASTASAKATSNAATIASVSSTANSALSVANSNAKVLPNKLDKADLTWSNVAGRPDVDKIASQASQAVVTANTAQSQASAAGQAASNASVQASAAKASADTATVTANAAKASASTASATAASAQQVANSASASASATAVALKSKADTATVNTQFNSVNSSVASAQSTADSAVAGLANKLDKTALTWGNIANKPIDLATTDSVAKAQSAANSAVSMASGATTTANSAKSAATSAVGVANTANTTANSALTKANSAATVASQANSTATQASQSASSAISVANQAKSTADNVNNRLWSIQANGGGRNLLRGTRDFSGVSIQGSKIAVTNGIEKFQAATGTQNSSQTYFDLLTFAGVPLEKDTDYTASFWVKTSENTEIWSFLYDSGSNGNYADGATKSQSTTDYTRIVVHFHNGNNNATPNFIPVRINKKSTITVWLYGCMLEKGKVAHDWSPAPEDTQSEIDANKMAAANAQASASNAQNTANSALSKANSNATTLETKITKSDLTWANISGKPSIPDDDATTTVSSGDLNNYTTTGKYYMPNSLANYTNHPTTGTDMGNWFVMKVDSYINGLMIIQTIYQINTGDVWIRQRWSGAWKSWRQINFWG